MGAYDYFEVTDEILGEQQLARQWKQRARKLCPRAIAIHGQNGSKR